MSSEPDGGRYKNRDTGMDEQRLLRGKNLRIAFVEVEWT
jgi:hypothetical protein